MKIILTTHVKERRAKGNIPSDRLKRFARFLIDTHNLENKEDGSYKFRKGRTQAIIVKKNKKAIFVTLFGPSGYIIDNNEYGEFSCILQAPDRKVRIQQKKAARKAKKKLQKLTIPLKRISKDIQQKLKRSTFEIKALSASEIDTLYTNTGKKTYFYLVAKNDGYPFIELLGYDGAKITTLHKNIFNNILSENVI